MTDAVYTDLKQEGKALSGSTDFSPTPPPTTTRGEGPRPGGGSPPERLAAACEDRQDTTEQPPLSNRGVKHTIEENKQVDLGGLAGIGVTYLGTSGGPTLREVSIDWLTLTLRDPDRLEALKSVAGITPERWSGGQGFARGEMYRRTSGGWVRRFEPYSPDAHNSRTYESWEHSGRVSEDVLHLILCLERAKCTRIDLTVDFIFAGAQMPFYVRPEAFRQWTRPDLSWGGREDGTVHNPGCFGQTRYIGSKKSPRLLRVYEKHHERGDHDSAPILRVELQLRERHAEAAYQALRDGKTVGSLWKANLQEMLTFTPEWMIAGIADAELCLEPEERASVPEALAAMVKQWRAYLSALMATGRWDYLQHLLDTMPVNPTNRATLKREREVVEYLRMI